MTCLVIAHRGASGYRPEQTLQAQRLAIVRPMASSQEELGYAVAIQAKDGGASAAVAIGAMGEAQRVVSSPAQPSPSAHCRHNTASRPPVCAVASVAAVQVHDRVVHISRDSPGVLCHPQGWITEACSRR